MFILEQTEYAPQISEKYTRQLGHRQYELTDHLGNVHATLLDRKLEKGVTNGQMGYSPEMYFYTDYYPFGFPMPKRFGRTLYRYGFNGQEKDNEIYGEGQSYDFEFRNYDARLGRFWGIDPLSAVFPDNSSYAFAQNRPIDGIDLEGLEWQPVNDKNENVAPGSDNITGYNWVGFTEPGLQIGNGIYRQGQVPYPYTPETIANATIIPNAFGAEGTVPEANLWTGPNSMDRYISDRTTQSGRVISAVLSQNNIKMISGLDINIQRQATELLLRSELELGIPIRITEGYRSIATQNEYFSRGRSQSQLDAVGLHDVTAQPNLKKITTVIGGQSAHNYGLAFDIVGTQGGYDINWNIVGNLGISIGLEWGGSWRRFPDRPHFQVTNWRQLIH